MHEDLFKKNRERTARALWRPGDDVPTSRAVPTEHAAAYQRELATARHRPLASANPKEGLGIKKACLRYTPAALVLYVGEVMKTGAVKYGPFNWRENAVEAMTYSEAMERHLLAWREGQDLAEDSGLPHLAHIAASCAILLDAIDCGQMIDNRTLGPAGSILAAMDKTAPAFAAKPCRFD